MVKLKHFLTLTDISRAEGQALIARGIELKSMVQNGDQYQPLCSKILAMIFEQPSTRTRVSFEAGMAQLGGHAIFISPNDSQLGRGESIEDTARILSKMVDVIMIRTSKHETIECLAKHSSVPIINGLSNIYHPCQLLADMQTYYEHRGEIAGKTVTWVGDGNNMCHSYINAAYLYDFHLRFACPEGFRPNPEIVKKYPKHVKFFSDVKAAVKDSDLVVTDVWASMGQEQERKQRAEIFAPYQVTKELMALANDDALFFHCLPAHRGEEVMADVIDDAKTVVWEEAGNRLHSQKALIELLLIK